MNEHPLYSRSGDAQPGSSNSNPGVSTRGSNTRLANLLPASVSPTFQQTSTFYTHAPTAFHQTGSVFTPERKDYNLNPMLSSTCSSDNVMGGHHSGSMNGSVGRMTGMSIDGPSTSLLRTSGKEHPAAQQAEQMNDFMDAFFSDHEASTSHDPLLKDDHAGIDVDMAMTERIYDSKRGKQIRDRKDLDSLLTSEHDLEDDDDDLVFPVRQTGPGGSRIITRDEYTRAKRAEAARSRYQRMTEQERRIYNNRRRMRALGLDPDDPTKVDHEKVRVNLQYNNAKKAEAARLRYHRMSLDEKRAYNQRRTEAFRRRRQEEESLLSTPAGRISNEALSKAQQIMVRNAKKAEAARLRYQRMSPEQRKEYNAKRAHAKKIRAAMARGETPGMLSSNGSIASGDLSESFPSASNSMIIDSIVDPSPSGVRTVARQRVLNARHMQSNLSNSSILDEHPDDEDFDEEIDSIRRELQMGEERANDGQMMNSINKRDRDQEDDEHFIDVAGGVEEDMQHEGGVEMQTRREPVDEQDEILNRLEREVIRRTKMAQMALLRQRTERTHGNPRNTAPPTERCEKMMLTSDGEIVPMPMAEQEVFMQPVQQQYIDEKALMNMLMTGIDSTGCPIEIRLPDGTLITTEAMLKDSMSSGQTIMIHQLATTDNDGKETPLLDDNASGRSSILANAHQIFASNEVVIDGTGGVNVRTSSSNPDQIQKRLLSKARRAERARLRYHTMDPTVKQLQNARRAEMLRKSRARDEELCQMAENCDIMTLTEETRNSVIAAQNRRARRAEQARVKYHRMDSDERRQYNAMRDAQRRQRKRELEARQQQHLQEQIIIMAKEEATKPHTAESTARPQQQSSQQHSETLTPPSENPSTGENQQQIFTSYEIYPESIY